MFVTHSIEEALFLGSRVIVLDKGRIVEDSPVPFPYPRKGALRSDPEFIAMRDSLRRTIMSTEIASDVSSRGITWARFRLD